VLTGRFSLSRVATAPHARPAGAAVDLTGRGHIASDRPVGLLCGLGGLGGATSAPSTKRSSRKGRAEHHGAQCRHRWHKASSRQVNAVTGLCGTPRGCAARVADGTQRSPTVRR
jgi:hypothetical protein